MELPYVPAKAKKKLGDSSENFNFAGYSEQSMAYKLYNLITKHVLISWDVEFEEEEAWDGSVDNQIAIGTTIS